MTTRPAYAPRHLAPLRGGADFSAVERCRIDTLRAARAVVVLSQTADLFPPARDLYRRLLAGGALTPTAIPSIRIEVAA